MTQENKPVFAPGMRVRVVKAGRFGMPGKSGELNLPQGRSEATRGRTVTEHLETAERHLQEALRDPGKSTTEEALLSAMLALKAWADERFPQPEPAKSSPSEEVVAGRGHCPACGKPFVSPDWDPLCSSCVESGAAIEISRIISLVLHADGTNDISDEDAVLLAKYAQAKAPPPTDDEQAFTGKCPTCGQGCSKVERGLGVGVRERAQELMREHRSKVNGYVVLKPEHADEVEHALREALASSPEVPVGETPTAGADPFEAGSSSKVASADIERSLRKRIAELEARLEEAAPMHCAHCGPHVKIDEDGCCATCGRDAYSAEDLAALIAFKDEWSAKDGNSPGYNLQKARTYGEKAFKYRKRLIDAGLATQDDLEEANEHQDLLRERDQLRAQLTDAETKLAETRRAAWTIREERDQLQERLRLWDKLDERLIWSRSGGHRFVLTNDARVSRGSNGEPTVVATCQCIDCGERWPTYGDLCPMPKCPKPTTLSPTQDTQERQQPSGPEPKSERRHDPNGSTEAGEYEPKSREPGLAGRATSAADDHPSAEGRAENAGASTGDHEAGRSQDVGRRSDDGGVGSALDPWQRDNLSEAVSRLYRLGKLERFAWDNCGAAMDLIREVLSAPDRPAGSHDARHELVKAQSKRLAKLEAVIASQHSALSCIYSELHIGLPDTEKHGVTSEKVTEAVNAIVDLRASEPAAGEPAEYEVRREGSHVAVGIPSPLKEGFRPTGGRVAAGEPVVPVGEAPWVPKVGDSVRIRSTAPRGGEEHSIAELSPVAGDGDNHRFNIRLDCDPNSSSAIWYRPSELELLNPAPASPAVPDVKMALELLREMRALAYVGHLKSAYEDCWEVIRALGGDTAPTGEKP